MDQSISTNVGFTTFYFEMFFLIKYYYKYKPFPKIPATTDPDHAWVPGAPITKSPSRVSTDMPNSALA